jgi:AcrR family transcriptional regulator
MPAAASLGEYTGPEGYRGEWEGLALQKSKLSTVAVAQVPGRPRRSRVAKRTRRSREDILNRIVKAARGEFNRNGFAGATTAAIARKADVTEAQLFRYFGSKSNLFRETIFKPVDQHFLHFINQHMQEIRDAPSTAEMTDLYATELQRFIRENLGMLASLVIAQTYESAPAPPGINSLHTYFDRAASMMSRRLKDRARIDPRLTVRVVFGAVLASVMFKDWLFPAGLASDEAITAAVNDFIKEGIRANFKFGE